MKIKFLTISLIITLFCSCTDHISMIDGDKVTFISNTETEGVCRVFTSGQIYKEELTEQTPPSILCDCKKYNVGDTLRLK